MASKKVLKLESINFIFWLFVCVCIVINIQRRLLQNFPSEGKVNTGKQFWKLTLQIEALALRPIAEPDGVVRIINGPQNVQLPPDELIAGDDARLQLGELVGAAPDPDPDGRLLLLVGGVEDSLHARFPVLKRRFDDRVSDSQLLHYVAGLQHAAGPFVGSGAPL